MAAISSEIIGGLQLADSFLQSEDEKTQGALQKSQFESNARLADIKAEEEARKGSKEASRFKKDADKVIGSQKVALAGQGIDITSGSGAQIQDETRLLNALDETTIKNNAMRRALGFKVEASQGRFAGALAERSANTRSRNTLLSGGLSAASSFVKSERSRRK